MELRAYQKEGVERILQIIRQRGSAYLADEMGLGKTAQAIQVIKELRMQLTLVVCPASLRLNWEREINQWSDLRPVVALKLEDFWARVWAPGSVVILSYELATKLDAVGSFDLLILDEVHYCKTATAKRTKACFKYLWDRAQYRLLLSGTPLPNGVMDGFTIFNRLAPEVFSDRYRYGFRYTEAKRNWFTGGWDFKGGKNLKELKGKVAPFMVRRRKSAVLSELPPKVYSQVPIKIAGAQDYRLSPEHEALVKEGKLAQLSTACATQRRGLGLLKVPEVVAYSAEVARQKKRLVVFAYHKAVIEILSESLSAVCISGDTPMRQRYDIIVNFQAPGGSMILVAQIQAAGIGINLTAADTCIFAELDWSPANMAQAIDRLHRIGQAESVAIHYLVAKGTMDESIIGTLHQKIRAINEVV